GTAIWITAGAVLLAVAGIAVWRLSGTPPRADSGSGPLRPMQLTAAPGLAFGTSLSPDEKSLAFSSDRSGRFEVYVRPDSPKGTDRPITSDGQQNIEPSWSPDGKTIA